MEPRTSQTLTLMHLPQASFKTWCNQAAGKNNQTPKIINILFDILWITIYI